MAKTTDTNKDTAIKRQVYKEVKILARGTMMVANLIKLRRNEQAAALLRRIAAIVEVAGKQKIN